MYVEINGFDHSLDAFPIDAASFDLSINDPVPKAKLNLYDVGSTFAFDDGQEVILWDENAGVVPSRNIIGLAVDLNNNPPWVPGGALSGLITFVVGTGGHDSQISMTFSNNANTSFGLLSQTTLFGYVHPGQQYMFSAYVQATAPVGIQSIVKFVWLDGTNTQIGAEVADYRTPPTSRTRINVSATAPSNAVFVTVSIGAQTVNATNSGTVLIDTPQLEPMTFLAQGVSYPTPDCTYLSVDSSQMPDFTMSRTCRIFSGTIDTFDKAYNDSVGGGKNRTWHISLAGPGALFENGLVNGVFSSAYDSTILTTVINSYFNQQIGIVAPNQGGASPILQGALIDSVSYNDNTLREVCNGLVDDSGFMFYLDMYYTLRYNPSYYAVATFALSDSPDNITTFPYYEYTYTKDGTQQKKNIKVIGGRFIAPAITDIFSGNGSQTVFNLTQKPYAATGWATVGGTAQKTGVKGVNKLGVSGYLAYIDKANGQLIFQTAPASGTNNVTIPYTYEAPVSVSVLDENAINLQVTPNYATPNYDAKVNDSNITSIAAAIQRGLAELTKFGTPRPILKLKSQKFAPAGYTIFLTSALDGISNQPFIVQTVHGQYLGNRINEYTYQLGAYNPTLLDHIRNANKALNRSLTTANITTPLQTDIVLNESITYGESLSFNLITPATSTYGTGHYGANTYA